jgi:hypothetical protein
MENCDKMKRSGRALEQCNEDCENLQIYLIRKFYDFD